MEHTFVLGRLNFTAMFSTARSLVSKLGMLSQKHSTAFLNTLTPTCSLVKSNPIAIRPQNLNKSLYKIGKEEQFH